MFGLRSGGRDLDSEVKSSGVRHNLASARRRIPEKFRTPNQFLGRQYAGCGATIGVMPRCDFACRGCYLGKEANRIPPESISGIKRQLDAIRAWLGDGGNVQITDGEVTLRPLEELLEIVRYARRTGLIPMLMTHGDTFLKSPDILRRLIEEAGLTEISVHIDTTQRGRKNREYRHAKSELELMALRDRFAELIREIRRQTGKSLQAATTFTLTDENLDQVPDVVQWAIRNADAFKMISFQPLARVGRTEAGLAASLTLDALWNRIARGLAPQGPIPDLINHQGLFGHPACTRFVQGIVVDRSRHARRFYPLYSNEDTDTLNFLEDFPTRFGGISLRALSRAARIQRIALAGLRESRFVLTSVLPFLARSLAQYHPQGLLGTVASWITGNTRLNYLNIVSHHFMNRAELETPLGRERLDLCAFKVPINGSLVSMCEVNAAGIRDEYYRSLAFAARRGTE
ncbi:MAG: radical SAM protein [Methylococcaceae bacterium]|nr:radical SAM protein [Methylococcaceae bacterium]